MSREANDNWILVADEGRVFEDEEPIEQADASPIRGVRQLLLQKSVQLLDYGIGDGPEPLFRVSAPPGWDGAFTPLDQNRVP